MDNFCLQTPYPTELILSLHYDMQHCVKHYVKYYFNKMLENHADWCAHLIWWKNHINWKKPLWTTNGEHTLWALLIDIINLKFT